MSAVSTARKRRISIQPATVMALEPLRAQQRHEEVAEDRHGHDQAGELERCSYAIEPLEHEEEDREGERAERQRGQVAERVQDGGEDHALHVRSPRVKPACRCDLLRIKMS